MPGCKQDSHWFTDTPACLRPRLYTGLSQCGPSPVAASFLLGRERKLTSPGDKPAGRRIGTPGFQLAMSTLTGEARRGAHFDVHAGSEGDAWGAPEASPLLPSPA